MRFFGYLLLFVVFFGCKDDDSVSNQQSKQIQVLVDEQVADFRNQMQQKPIGIGLYVIDDDSEFYVSAGFPDTYRENIHFRVASNSKTFTAAAILKLHQEGKLDINDKITDIVPSTNRYYLPDTPQFNIPNKSQITIKLLLQHRAGVFDVTNNPIPQNVNAAYAGQFYVDYIKETQGDNHTFTFEELIAVVAEHQLSDFTPDATFHYSNTGYNILGYIIENVSGLRLHQYLQDNFIEPLDLSNTYSPHMGSDQQLPLPYTLSYVQSEDQIIEIDNDNLSANISEGHIISTPKSLAKWAKLLLGTHQVLEPSTLAMMMDAVPADESHGFYGLGIQAHPTNLGYGHDGAHLAYLSTMRYIPEKNRTYVIFTNHLNVDNFVEEANALYDILIKANDILDD